MEAIKSAQKRTTGTVKVHLYKGARFCLLSGALSTKLLLQAMW